MLERIVALATLVKSKEALTAQLAMNHMKQKTMASLAVSCAVKESVLDVWTLGVR
jgi:hypothetical protein